MWCYVWPSGCLAQFHADSVKRQFNKFRLEQVEISGGSRPIGGQRGVKDFVKGVHLIPGKRVQRHIGAFKIFSFFSVWKKVW